MSFTIRAVDENRGKTIPAHYDICPEGQDDSIITVWDSKHMAEEIVAIFESRELVLLSLQYALQNAPAFREWIKARIEKNEASSFLGLPSLINDVKPELRTEREAIDADSQRV